MDRMGNSELRQGTTAPDRAYGTWRGARTVPQRAGGSDQIAPFPNAGKLSQETLMLGPDNIREITNQVLAFSKADQTEVLFQGTESALTRFANSSIHQNVAESDTHVRVRVVYGKKVGVASGNDLSPDSLKSTVETARAIAQHQMANPNFKSLPEPKPVEPVAA